MKTIGWDWIEVTFNNISVKIWWSVLSVERTMLVRRQRKPVAHTVVLSKLHIRFSSLIWGRCNLKRSRRTVIFLPVYKISSLKITPPKTPNSGQFSYPLPNSVSFLFRLEFRFRSCDFSFNLFPVWQPYCWRFWRAIVVLIYTSTIKFGSVLRNNL